MFVCLWWRTINFPAFWTNALPQSHLICPLVLVFDQGCVVEYWTKSEVPDPVGSAVIKLKQKGFWVPAGLAGKVCVFLVACICFVLEYLDGVLCKVKELQWMPISSGYITYFNYLKIGQSIKTSPKYYWFLCNCCLVSRYFFPTLFFHPTYLSFMPSCFIYSAILVEYDSILWVRRAHYTLGLFCTSPDNSQICLVDDSLWGSST